MIHAHSVSLSFGSRILFNKISFDVRQDQRIGLIGANGSGKSTLLEAIVGLQHIDDGSIVLSKNKKIAYLSQDIVLSSQLSIIDETMTAFQEFIEISQKLAALEERMHNNPTADELDDYAQYHEKLAEFNPDSCRADCKKMLLGLGFKDEDLDKPVASLSIGWRMRIVLAKLLLQKADFYLFDEPTNHLDIFAKDWFLEFLQNASFGFMLVCHERYFLDALCKQILELERGKATFYQGNFSSYQVQKEHNLALLESAYQLQQKEIKQKEETIARFKASASRAKQAQSMIKQLDKIERIVMPPSARTINFNFPPISRSGKVVLKVENLGFSFGDKRLFKDVNFEVERGEKVALVASNGGGKTTLLNVINGKLPIQEGTVQFGSNVTYTLFDQDQNAALDGKKSVLDNIEGNCPPGVTTAAVRSFLGAFLFSGEDVDKKVEVLSGGEKNRVGMVKVLLQQTNLLLLDEPTNHLDIDSKKVLLEALRKYDGTIIFVSHDRAFLNDLATRVVELTPNGVISFTGNYDQFLYYKKQLMPQTELASSTKSVDVKVSEQKNTFELQKKIRSLEKKIDYFEEKIRDKELSFGNLVYGTDAFKKAETDLKSLQKQRDQCMHDWESMQKVSIDC